MVDGASCDTVWRGSGECLPLGRSLDPEAANREAECVRLGSHLHMRREISLIGNGIFNSTDLVEDSVDRGLTST